MNVLTDQHATAEVATTKLASWNPLRTADTGLPMNLAVMVKAMALALLLTHNLALLPTPWLPFIPWISYIPQLLFQRTLEFTFLASIFMIFFNRRLQWGAFILGATILVGIVSSKTYYGNNRTFIGLILLFAGCYKEGGPPFIRWQLALTYFGAGLNKAFDHDWHTGVFFDYWAFQRLHESLYVWLRARISPLALGKFFCWYTIFSELGVVPLLLSPSQSWFYWGVLANIVFQCSLFLFVGNTFSMFWYAMCGASFAFVAWPRRPSTVLFSGRFSAAIMRLLKFADVDHQFQWESAPGSLKLITDRKTYTGARALRMIVLYNPLTYYFIVAVVALAAGNGIRLLVFRRVFLSLLLVLLMPPLAWCIDKCFRQKTQEA